MLLGYPLRQDLPSIYGTWIPFRKQNRCPATCLQHLQQETNRNRGRLSANMFCSIKLTASESFRCRICSGDSNFADRLPLQRSLRKYIASQRFAYNCASESSKRHQKGLKQLSWFIPCCLWFKCQANFPLKYQRSGRKISKDQLHPIWAFAGQDSAQLLLLHAKEAEKKNVEFGK